MPQYYSSYIHAIEDDNWRACIGAASKDGHTQEEAENCESGSLKCSICPWATDMVITK